VTTPNDPNISLQSSPILRRARVARETARESRRRARRVRALDDDAPFFLPALLEKSAEMLFPLLLTDSFPPVSFFFFSLKKRHTLSRFAFA
jgi:hypothetical protein